MSNENSTRNELCVNDAQCTGPLRWQSLGGIPCQR
jgi:hypothetical protein